MGATLPGADSAYLSLSHNQAGETVSAVVHSSSASEHTMVINEKTSFMGHYVQD